MEIEIKAKKCVVVEKKIYRRMEVVLRMTTCMSTKKETKKQEYKDFCLKMRSDKNGHLTDGFQIHGGVIQTEQWIP